MKRTHLTAVVVCLAVVAIITTNASAMYNPRMGTFLQRDPGPGAGGPARPGAGGPSVGGGFVPRDQYADGMSLYQYVRSAPPNYVDWNGAQASSTTTSPTTPGIASTQTAPDEPSSAPSTSGRISSWADGQEYSATTERITDTDQTWAKIAAGELTECPNPLVLPRSVADAVSTALDRTLKTRQEHGGVIMGKPPNITTWRAVSQGKRSVDPRLASPAQFRKDAWGAYHAHPLSFVGSRPDYTGARTTFSLSDIVFAMKNNHFVTVVRDCKCTMAVVLLKSELKGIDRAKRWFERTGFNPRIRLPHSQEDPDAYRRRQNADVEAQERILVNEGATFGTCYYLNCRKKQDTLQLQRASERK